jgi:hypothetical protein
MIIVILSSLLGFVIFFVLKRDNYYSAIAIFSPYLKGRTYTALELHRIEIHMLEKEVNLFKLMNKILSP